MNNEQYLKYHYVEMNDMELASIYINLTKNIDQCSIDSAIKAMSFRLKIVKKILVDRGVY